MATLFQIGEKNVYHYITVLRLCCLDSFVNHSLEFLFDLFLPSCLHLNFLRTILVQVFISKGFNIFNRNFVNPISNFSHPQMGQTNIKKSWKNVFFSQLFISLHAYVGFFPFLNTLIEGKSSWHSHTVEWLIHIIRDFVMLLFDLAIQQAHMIQTIGAFKFLILVYATDKDTNRQFYADQHENQSRTKPNQTIEFWLLRIFCDSFRLVWFLYRIEIIWYENHEKNSPQHLLKWDGPLIKCGCDPNNNNNKKKKRTET